MKVKKIAIGIVCSLMIVATMGITVLAAGSGYLSVGLSGNTAYATLTNTSGSARYCAVSIYEYNGANVNEATLVASNTGVVADNASISTSGTVTKEHAIAYGYVYNSSSPSSGVAASYSKPIK